MAKFTIKDLAEGRCAVKNDGTLEELNKVLKAAFPIDIEAVGNATFYQRLGVGQWIGKEIIGLSTQSVKDFLEELEKSKLPKRGDIILVSDNAKKWDERIFITYIENAQYPVICVNRTEEGRFKDGDKFIIAQWRYWKSIPEKKVLEVTLEDVAKQFKVDEVKIVEKKG